MKTKKKKLKRQKINDIQRIQSSQNEKIQEQNYKIKKQKDKIEKQKPLIIKDNNLITEKK